MAGTNEHGARPPRRPRPPPSRRPLRPWKWKQWRKLSPYWTNNFLGSAVPKSDVPAPHRRSPTPTRVDMNLDEQRNLLRQLVEKVGYDGRTGKVTVSFKSAGVKELV
jgi:hypothetical protein